MGTLYKTESLGRKNSIYHVQYIQPKEYIWSRRKDLKGTELRIGYIPSATHLKVENISDVVREDELVDGKMVSSPILTYSMNDAPRPI